MLRTVLRRSFGRSAAALLVVAAGCADDGASTMAPAVAPTVIATVPTSVPGPTPADLPETDAVAELGYPRDLLDRGRVNVVLTRDDDVPFVLLDHQLRVDGFEPAPPEERRIVVPTDGRRVAVQAIFGEVVDCELPTPLAASLAVHYTVGDDPDVREGAIELDDTVTLAEIRARFCTARRMTAENAIVLGAPMHDGETFAVDLTIARRAGDAELVVHAIEGTVLFGVESPYEQGAPERTLSPGARELVLPVTFDVNRCDPHAVAETTKKKGLTLWIAVDGAPPQPVDVDITPIEGDLEEILDRCSARTGRWSTGAAHDHRGDGGRTTEP